MGALSILSCSTPGIASEEATILEVHFVQNKDAEVRALSNPKIRGRMEGESQATDAGRMFQGKGWLQLETEEGLARWTPEAFAAEVVYLVNQPKPTQGDGIEVILNGVHESENRAWQMYLDRDRYICFYVRDSEGRPYVVRSVQPVEDGQRLHILGALGKDGMVALYLNGGLQERTESPGVQLGASKHLLVGAQNNSGARPLAGTVAAVRLIDHPLLAPGYGALARGESFRPQEPVQLSAEEQSVFKRLELQWNGKTLQSLAAPLTVLPGLLNQLKVEAHRGAKEGAIKVRLRYWMPNGESAEHAVQLSPGESELLNCGPMLAPPVFEFRAGEVYQYGYRLQLEVIDGETDTLLGNWHYHQGLASEASRWRVNESMLAGAIRLLPGEAASVRFNPMHGVESSVAMELDSSVLLEQDSLKIRLRIQPGALIDTLPGMVTVSSPSDRVLFRQRVHLPAENLWVEVEPDPSAWEKGEYTIDFHPEVGGTLWQDGPSLPYRRKEIDRSQILVSPYAPWTLEKDLRRAEVKVMDFSSMIDGWEGWFAGENKAGALYQAGEEHELTFDPKLEGTYMVLARAHGDGCAMQIGTTGLVRQVRNQTQSEFLEAVDMTGKMITLFPQDVRVEGVAGLAEITFIPVTEVSAKSLYQQTSSPPVTIAAVNDWAEYFGGANRIALDQFEAILGAQAEIGFSDIGWSIGRSWVEYESALPATSRFPVVPLEEALKTNPRAMHYEGRARMMNEFCPLRAVYSKEKDYGVTVFPWLSMNRHYGPGAHGGIFTSQWFLDHPGLRRWRKQATEADRSEVSYYFPEVRQERLDIFLEVAELGANGLLVGTTRQVPMILYHPEMVAEYFELTGVDPQQIDYTDGEKYLNWIRWRADFFTQVLRDLRKGVSAIEQRQQRSIPIAVRIPSAGLLYNMAQGLDVEQWLKEGLVDRLQLNPLEDRGGRGSHDVEVYLELARRHGIEVFGGIGATILRRECHFVALQRALGLLEAGVDGIEIYEAEMFARPADRRWLVPLVGYPDLLRSFLQESNLEGVFPITAQTAASGYDNHSIWHQGGYDVEGFGINSL